jgi:hypothetical protein
MSRRFRDLYEAKVKGAIPANEEEDFLFQLSLIEENHETLEKMKSLADAIAKQKQTGGAPRKTAGDTKLAERLVKNHNGNIKLARREFIQIVINSDPIEPKSARARFKAALKSLKT